MRRGLRVLAAAGSLSFALFAADAAVAQKAGGILKISHFDSPASMSPLEESTAAAVRPTMGVFNNLVVYDQNVPQNSMRSIVPELATGWSTNEEGTELVFPLRQGVKWHDGQPFTARDVKCTWDLLAGKTNEKLRINPRKSWYSNVEEVTPNGDFQITFRLKRSQPALLALLASGCAPIYPCHVSPRDMRTHPIGTGPFKFVEYRPGQDIRFARNPDYWKPGLPYLDGVEYTIIPNRSTAILGFIAGKFDMTFPYEVTIPLLKDIKNQAPQAMCQVGPATESIGVLVNRTASPFDNAELRRAIGLTLDRKAFIDILGQGEGDLGGALLPPPEGVWGMPTEKLQQLPGYADDVKKNREQARGIMQKLGYGPDKRLTVTISTRNIAVYRDPAAILIDQLKEIYIDGELENIETANWVPKLIRKDFKIGLNVLGTAVDDPDVVFYQNYVCSSARNYPGYCNPELDKKVDQQSMESDPAKRKQLAQEVDYQLQQELARPIIYHLRAATCWQPELKNLTLMVNSQ